MRTPGVVYEAFLDRLLTRAAPKPASIPSRDREGAVKGFWIHDTRERRRGNMILECAMWIPFVLLLLVGMVQFGKITYVYYTVKKTLYTVGRYVATSQGVNFCDTTGDATIVAAKNFALTGTADGSAESPLPALTSDMISVSAECVDPSSGDVGPCSTGGCDGPGGGPHPDFVVVSVPDGYQVSPRIPYMLIDPILLKPEVRVPFGGT